MTRAGIHQITLPIPFPLQTVHVYLVEAGSGWIMVDSGFPSIEAREKLESEVTRLIGGMESLSAVIITHFHPDHSGLAGWIQSKRDVPVYIHTKDNERLSMMRQAMSGNGEGPPGMPGSASGGAFAALPQGGTPDWERMREERDELSQYELSPMLVQESGEATIDGRPLEFVWTPGHTEGHLCVYDRGEDLLFTGDHLLSRITPHIGMWAPGMRDADEENPLIEFERSCRLVEELNPGYALPAHEADVDHPAERSLEIREHHQDRRREMLEAVEGGARTGYAISRIVFAKRTEPMQQYMALSETLAHLDALVVEGALSASENEDAIYTVI
jgi:glyoxylase-like metal-dependent hydrolase (beta-lactamase superfamily II)